MFFRNAIVRPPSPAIINGLSTENRGKPDFNKAILQHSEYINALKFCGLTVKIMEPEDNLPDSTFIEDIALCTEQLAIITNPGAPTRKAETKGIENVLEQFFDKIEMIKSPGTLEAGDVMMAGSEFYIGVSGRTNPEGADQLISILSRYGMKGIKVPLRNLLHLKSGLSYLENNNLLLTEELFNNNLFNRFNKISVIKNESYAANSLWINGKVLMPEGFPETRNKIEKAGYETIVLDVSEFRKVDGGLSCISLRF